MAVVIFLGFLGPLTGFIYVTKLYTLCKRRIIADMFQIQQVPAIEQVNQSFETSISSINATVSLYMVIMGFAVNSYFDFAQLNLIFQCLAIAMGIIIRAQWTPCSLRSIHTCIFSVNRWMWIRSGYFCFYCLKSTTGNWCQCCSICCGWVRDYRSFQKQEKKPHQRKQYNNRFI